MKEGDEKSETDHVATILSQEKYISLISNSYPEIGCCYNVTAFEIRNTLKSYFWKILFLSAKHLYNDCKSKTSHYFYFFYVLNYMQITCATSISRSLG